MSKDFYSDNHTIQAGAPGGGSGDFKIKTEGDCIIDSTGDINATAFKAEIFGSDQAKLFSDGYVTVRGEGEVNIETGDGTLLYLGSDVQLNRRLIILNSGADITGNVDITGDLSVSGSINGSISGAGISSDSDINITTTDSVNVDAGYQINLTAEDITATANDKLRLKTSGGTEILLTESTDSIQMSCGILNIAAGTATITSGGGLTSISSTSISTSSTSNTFSAATNTFSGSKSSGYLMSISNTSSASGADLMDLSLDNITTPTYGNNWVRFKADGISRGAIQGSSAGRSNYLVIQAGAAALEQYATNGLGSPLTTADGNVQYASGNEDFGEWIPIGDEAEWGITEEIRQELAKASTFPVQEGVTLYIRDSKVWKSGPGRGMVVTNRAIVVGNQNFKEDGKLGIIMSFIGQVPTFVEGAVEDGDLLVPMEGTNHCKAINPDQISFQDYRKAVGTAWGKKLTSKVGLVNCAIGVK